MAYIQFQFRRGTASEWAAANTVLANGEIGVVLDTRNFKVGDGTTAWTNLSYGGLQGSNGIGVSSMTVNSNGHLMITYSNSATANAGYVVGPQGSTGAAGSIGATGATGANGIGVSSATVNGNGSLIITYSNSATSNAGYVIGPQGSTGSNGVSITNSTVNSNGYLIITYSNSATSNAGYVVGNFDANTAGSLNVNSALTSNNASYLGGNSAADLRTYADNKAGNAYSNAVAYTDATFQTMTGLSANVAILSANAATYLNGKTESNLNVNNSLTSNNASYLGGNTASDLRTYTDNKAGNAYTNATTFASNATNISGGTLGEARLPYRMDQNVRTTDTVSFGNMTITGNLTVTGNVAVIGANNLTLIDNMIYLNSNNNVTNPDLGFAGNYNDGSYHHAGFFRDATDGFWKVFDNYAPEPDASPYIDTANATFHIADFHANTHRVGNTSVYATINSTAFSGSANNASYLGGTAAAGYQTTAGLSANVATLTANAAGYLNGKTESNLNVNSALIANLATYIVANTGLVSNSSGVFVNASYVATQNANNATYAFGKSEGNLNVNNALTANSASYLGSKQEAGLNVNSALTANAATYLNGKTESNLNVNNSLTSNNSSYLGGVAAANYIQNTDSRTLSGNLNFTGSNVQFGTHYIGNDSQLRFRTVNTAAYAYFVQQSDDNFVFYTSNTAYGQRAVWSIYANSTTSAVNFATPVNFNANVGTLYANGSVGATNQILTSNGSTVYWSSPGAASVNAAAQYTWTNTQTFSANISFTGNNISVVNGTGSIQFNGAGDTNWRIGRSTGSLTKTFYTNNSLDIIAGGSNLEGIVFGNGSNTYMEVGANGVYTKNQIYVGSTTTNLAITSTSITGRGGTELSITSNNMTLGSANGIALYSTTGQANAASGNLVGYGYAALGGAGGNYLVFGQQTDNFAQWIQSGYSSSTSVYYNIILNPLGGSIGVGNTIPTAKFSVNGTTYLQGNVTLTQGVVDSTGSQGTAGQVLTSNGSGNVYWSTVSGGGSVNVAAQYTWTNTQTFSNTITFNSTIVGTVNNALYLNGTAASGYQTTAGLSANVATLTSNNSSYLGGVVWSSYVQDTDSRSLSGNLNFTGANTTISGNLTIASTGELIITNGAGIYANGGLGSSGQVLTTNGTSVYWSTPSSGGGSSNVTTGKAIAMAIVFGG